VKLSHPRKFGKQLAERAVSLGGEKVKSAVATGVVIVTTYSKSEEMQTCKSIQLCNP
jgi:hypothetical protein